MRRLMAGLRYKKRISRGNERTWLATSRKRFDQGNYPSSNTIAKTASKHHSYSLLECNLISPYVRCRARRRTEDSGIRAQRYAAAAASISGGSALLKDRPRPDAHKRKTSMVECKSSTLSPQMIGRPLHSLSGLFHRTSRGQHTWGQTGFRSLKTAVKRHCWRGPIGVKVSKKSRAPNKKTLCNLINDVLNGALKSVPILVSEDA